MTIPIPQKNNQILNRNNHPRMARRPIRLGGRIVPIMNPVPWQKKALAYRAYHRPASPGQLGAQAQLAETASAHFGERGFVNGIPVIAADVAAELTGRETASQYGQSSMQRAENARNLRHQQAMGKAAALRSAAAAKAGQGGGRGFPSGRRYAGAGGPGEFYGGY